MTDREWIAAQVHEVLRGIDPNQPAWDDAPAYMREATLNGVNVCLDNDVDPAESHAVWCAQMMANGWVYGETKDVEAKKHPCLVPYGALSETNRMKDRVFVATVKSLHASIAQRPAPKVHSDLDALLKTQYKLQARVGTWDKIKNNPASRQQFINQMILGAQDELLEALHETAWKNPEYMPHGWKKGQKHNAEGFRKEIIDVLHLWLALALVADLDAPTIMSEYMSKNQVNLERQDNGY